MWKRGCTIQEQISRARLHFGDRTFEASDGPTAIQHKILREISNMDAYVFRVVRVYLLILIEEVTIYFPAVVDIYGYKYEVRLCLVRI